MNTPKSPRSGDVIVHRSDVAGSTTPFIVGIFDRFGQFGVSSHRAAHRYADGFAECHGLDVWDTQDGLLYSSSASYRPD